MGLTGRLTLFDEFRREWPAELTIFDEILRDWP